MKTITAMIATGLAALALQSAGAHAERTHAYFTKDHLLTAGIFDQDSDAELIAQRGEFEPLVVDFANLGISEGYTSYLLEYRFRLNDRWKLGAMAYRFNEGSQRVIEETFNFGGVEFEAGANLASQITLDTYVIDASYSVFGTDNADLAVGFGLHAIDISAAIGGVATIDGETVGNIQEARTTLLAPLPNLRASGFYAFSDALSVHGTLGWLSATIDDFSGSFVYAHLRGSYMLTDNIGASLGYQLVDFDLEEQKDNGFNDYNLRFSGLTASLSYAF